VAEIFPALSDNAVIVLLAERFDVISLTFNPLIFEVVSDFAASRLSFTAFAVASKS